MIYACMSDIHGRGSELLKCLNFIEKKRSVYPDMKVAFLGDYCDRGTENLLVLDSIMNYKNKYPETITIMGNHDEFLIGSLWYNKLSDYSYMRTLYNMPRQIYNIWTYSPNGGSKTYWELVHKCEDAGEDISNLGREETCKNKSIKKYIKFLADNPLFVIENGIVFTHAPIPRWYYKTMESIKQKINYNPYDALWNVNMKKLESDDERYLSIHGHIHLNGEKAKIIEEGLYICCATEPHVSVSFFDTERDVKNILVNFYCAD